MRCFRILTVTAVAAILLGIGTVAAGRRAFCRPYCLYEDCRGRELDVEELKRWEKRAQDGALGILRIAGWRTGTEQTVVSSSTGRKRKTAVTLVYGSMELADKARLLRGRFGVETEEEYCVISQELAGNLFGTAEAEGEWIKTEGGKMKVVGIIEKEGEILLAPMEMGKVEYLSVEFNRRVGAEKKMKRLMEEY